MQILNQKAGVKVDDSLWALAYGEDYRFRRFLFTLTTIPY